MISSKPNYFSNSLLTAMCSVVQSCLTLCNSMDCSPPGSCVHGDSPGMSTGEDCHTLLQGIFPTQGSKLHLPHWQADFFTTVPPGNHHRIGGRLECYHINLGVTQSFVQNKKLLKKQAPQMSSYGSATFNILMNTFRILKYYIFSLLSGNFIMTLNISIKYDFNG